jgi:hypothetical protein
MNKLNSNLCLGMLFLISCVDTVDSEDKGGCHTIKTSSISKGAIECAIQTKSECDSDLELFSNSYGATIINSFHNDGKYGTCERSFIIDSLKENSTKWVGALQYPERNSYREGRLYARFLESGAVDHDIACGANPSYDCSKLDGRYRNEIIFPDSHYSDHYILSTVLAEQSDGYTRMILMFDSAVTVRGVDKKFGTMVSIDGPTKPTRANYSNFGKTPPVVLKTIPQDDLDVLDWVTENAHGNEDK